MRRWKRVALGGMSTIISFPVSLGVYWALLIYLFSMDPGDSWTVVILLAVFDNIVRWLLLLLLLNSVLGFGGVASALSGGSSSDTSFATEQRIEMQDLDDAGQLPEARKYAADGHSVVLTEQVNAWYAAGAKRVSYELSGRDINGRADLQAVVVELPDDKDKRAACYKVLHDYRRTRDADYTPDPSEDEGDPFLVVPLGFN